MIINGRFRIDASRNEVLDIETGKSVRLEPRLMKLLCLLIEYRGQIVNRSLIIKQIWNDYPGAGEGLNQAISGLRKLLEDDQKKVIETLPKSGYCFNGTIEETPVKYQTLRLKPVYILTGILMLIAILFLVRYYQSTEASISEQLSQKEARHIYKIDSARQAEKLKGAKK
jgi:DNA-binding winged helix-turn-helix (wHTH) protein